MATVNGSLDNGKHLVLGRVNGFCLSSSNNINNRKVIYMKMNKATALQKIMEIIALPGEEYTDGECLDSIISVLEELGMPIDEEIKKGRK